jgi:hypothetical protein
MFIATSCLIVLINSLYVNGFFQPFTWRGVSRISVGSSAMVDEPSQFSLHNKPLKILLLVEPTPFNYVSGYANRFKEMLTHLKDMGSSFSCCFFGCVYRFIFFFCYYRRRGTSIHSRFRSKSTKRFSRLSYYNCSWL